MSELSKFVNTNGMVSSKVVAEKFGKKHKNVLRAINDAKQEMSNDFYRLNFEPIDIAGKTLEVLMSRDAFSIIAMGFTGGNAMQWKEKFLSAFNEMEKTISEEIPTLRSQIAHLQQHQRIVLPQVKKPHGNKGMVWVPVAVETLFGTQLEYKKAAKTDERFSEMSRMEGEINRLSRLAGGMTKKIQELNATLALRRRH